LLKVVRDLLDPFHSHAIVATHSPVVVQETLGRHVLVLHRIDNRTNWQPSIRETFGENLATLTRESLGLPAERADYIGRLKEVIKKDTQLEDIEKLFGTRGMSSPARAQTLRIISAVQSGQKV
jgi:predicted ATP-binding protein involved in virulence